MLIPLPDPLACRPGLVAEEAEVPEIMDVAGYVPGKSMIWTVLAGSQFSASLGPGRKE
jgi:hypothetical protein